MVLKLLLIIILLLQLILTQYLKLYSEEPLENAQCVF
nr:MAG TPA: hypothetical protein [Bacteriophage sp.]